MKKYSFPTEQKYPMLSNSYELEVLTFVFFRCCKKYSLITRYCGQHSLENFNNFSLMFDSKLKSEKNQYK